MTMEHHKERILAYLGGFQGLLLNLQEHLDAVAGSPSVCTIHAHVYTIELKASSEDVEKKKSCVFMRLFFNRR